MSEEAVYLDRRGFICVGSTKLPVRFDADRGALEFVDKDKRSSAVRGSRFVYLTPDQLMSAIAKTGGK